MSDTDEALANADASSLVKLAAAVSAVSGLFVALTGLQILGVRFRSEWIEYVPYVQITFGLGQIVCGAMIFRARPWAVYAGSAIGVFAAIGMAGWFLFFMSSVGLSCMVIIAPPISALAAVLTIVAIAGVRKTAAARRQLAEQGLDLGL